MMNTMRSLAYSTAIIGALTLAGCSSPNNTAQQAPASQHRFNVYFDVAKSDLTPEAQQVIAQAAVEASRSATTKIVVVAPETDKAGRTTKVQAALVAAGVASDRIDARWIGPQASPPPGVRDPRNRLVEISFEPNMSSVGDSASNKVFLSKRTSD
jgi:outer membrane protein OmpA-like peptidoglycan-associated protein